MAGLRTPRSTPVAQQILALQLVVLLVVVLGSLALAYTDARRDADDAATDQVLAVARTVAESPLIDEAIERADPPVVLQPYAELVRRDTATDFVVIMDPRGVRWTHPDPANIGGKFLGSIDRAQRGQAHTERYTGTLGPSIRAVVPVLRDDRVIALVAVGLTVAKVDDALLRTLPQLGAAALVVLAVGLAGALLISRRLRRQTHGLGEREITRMYEYYDAVLRAVREGLILLDRQGRIQLVNAEGARLLGLDATVTGRPVTEVGLPDELADALSGPEEITDEIHLVDARMLVVNRRPAGPGGRGLGSVVTLRDHTEIQALSGELDTVRGLADSLRAQNHEAANRLHTVVSLIEIGRAADAVAFATDELELAQQLTDRVVSAVEHPVVAALLLGKAAQAGERGVQLRLSDDSRLRELPVDPHDAVTLIGNLVDNAIDATGETDRPRQVRVDLRTDGAAFLLRVDDSGPGLDAHQRQLAFRRGWSTKTDDTRFGRGLGLALVVQVVRRYGGRIDVTTSPLGGASFSIEIPTRSAAAPR